MRSRQSAVLLLVLLMVYPIATGCFRGTRPAPDLMFLDIDPGPPPEHQGITLDVLLLRRFDVDSPFDDRRFIYLLGGDRYEPDYYVRFIASPADFLTARLEEWLDGSRLFKAVVEPGTSVEYRYVLEGAILELYGDYSVSDRPQAVIKIAFLLVDDREGAGELLLSKQYRRAEPLASSGARALASGWSTGLKNVFLELVSDLESSLADTGG